MRKMTKEESAMRDDGSHVAFMEAAQHCRDVASQLFLGLHDEEAKAVRGLVSHFLEQARLCRDVDES